MYTQENFDLASRLYRDEKYRQAIIEALELLATPIHYSNEDFDRKQALADLLTPSRRVEPALQDGVDNFLVELRFNSGTTLTDQQIQDFILRTLQPVEREFANDLDCEIMNRWKKRTIEE